MGPRLPATISKREVKLLPLESMLAVDLDKSVAATGSASVTVSSATADLTVVMVPMSRPQVARLANQMKLSANTIVGAIPKRNVFPCTGFAMEKRIAAMDGMKHRIASLVSAAIKRYFNAEMVGGSRGDSVVTTKMIVRTETMKLDAEFRVSRYRPNLPAISSEMSTEGIR